MPPWVSEQINFRKCCFFITLQQSVFICFAKLNKKGYEQNDAVAQQWGTDVFELAGERILRLHAVELLPGLWADGCSEAQAGVNAVSRKAKNTTNDYE